MAKIRKRGTSYQIDYFDPDGKRVRQSFKKKKEAEAELGKRVSLIGEGRYLDVKKEYTTTLKELIAKYEKNYKHQASFKRYKEYCLNNFKVYFGEDKKLVNIRYMDLETYRNHLRQKPTRNGGVRTDASINQEMAFLHRLFTKAIEWEMIERSPFDRGKTLLIKENNKRLRFLTEDEIAKLLEQCPKYLRYIVECALNTGMRRGEILSIKWDQIRNGFIYLQQTKTNELRQIPTNEDLERVFKEVRKERELTSEYVFTYRQNEDKLVGIRPVREGRNPRPQPKPVINVGRAFQTACKDAGIENFRFHDLRHTFTSHAIMRGTSLKDIQEVLGHKTMTMTLRYSHLTQEHKKKAVNFLNGLTASVKFDMSQNCHISDSRLSATS